MNTACLLQLVTFGPAASGTAIWKHQTFPRGSVSHSLAGLPRAITHYTTKTALSEPQCVTSKDTNPEPSTNARVIFRLDHSFRLEMGSYLSSNEAAHLLAFMLGTSGFTSPTPQVLANPPGRCWD